MDRCRTFLSLLEVNRMIVSDRQMDGQKNRRTGPCVALPQTVPNRR